MKITDRLKANIVEGLCFDKILIPNKAKRQLLYTLLFVSFLLIVLAIHYLPVGFLPGWGLVFMFGMFLFMCCLQYFYLCAASMVKTLLEGARQQRQIDEERRQEGHIKYLASLHIKTEKIEGRDEHIG